MTSLPFDEECKDSLIDFFGRWTSTMSEMCQSYRDMFLADTVWTNPGFPVFTGPDEAVGFLKAEAPRIGLDTIRVDVRHMIAEGGVVMSERIDHLQRIDGSTIISVPVLGVFEMTADHRIKAWREYADTTGVRAIGVDRGDTSQAHL